MRERAPLTRLSPVEGPFLRASAHEMAKADGRDGRLHMKALIIDSRLVYHGSANFTSKSRTNKELMQRLQGPPVQVVVEAVQEVRRQPL